ncbi:MAG TPA: Zn-ribbon domain-containing OB-fold protein [Acidimicrobiales bacterium]|nr:Zn-ribbon domain-containing OB-fold protein [Acidimicrobiales bacterium]
MSEDAPKPDPNEPVRSIRTPIHLEYRFMPGRASSRFLRGVQEGRLLGQRCPQCKKVYIPPRGACAACGVPTQDEVEVADKGTVTTFCVVNVPFYGQKIELPYVSATILLDGADIGLFHLIQEVEADKVHMGMRVEAVWAPPKERKPTLESILHFRPSDEPDADYETYKDHV